MTSKQVMLSLGAPRPIAWCALAAIALASTACSGPQLQEPRTFPSPYPGPKVWAVVPFRNESGTTLVDGPGFADKLVAHLQQVQGIEALPTNRVIEAMKARRMADVRSTADAMALLEALGVDGLLVGAISAWDPYDPPKIGAAVQLYSRQRDTAGSGIDSRQITAATTDPRVVVNRADQPVSTAGSYFDAANHAVLQNLQAYATGRTGIDTPSGARRYLLDMNLYSEFVSFELMRLLFKSEWQRLTVPATPASQQHETTTRNQP